MGTAGAPTAHDAELRRLLEDASGRLGEVYDQWAAGFTSPATIAERGAAANSGAAGNIVITIRAVLYGEIPTSPSRSLQSARSITTLLRDKDISDGTRNYLVKVKSQLMDVAGSAHAQAEEEASLEAGSAELETSIRNATGVYVYTFPNYFKHPWNDGSSRVLLKVGSTTRTAWQRIREQVRLTAMPEEPLLLRVYLTDKPEAVEKVFHRLLDAAEHERSGSRTAVNEWFATSLTYLDEVANALGLTIISADNA